MTPASRNDALCPEALARLRASPVEPQGAIGRAPRAWANHIEAGLGDRFNLDEHRIDRARLFDLAKEGEQERFFLSVMAWGGMKVGHGISAWAAQDQWQGPLEVALAGGESRADLFRRFAAAPVAGMPRNDHHAYEAFCGVVDAIGAALQVAGAQAEERIYSRGGRRPADWRAHVKANWRPSGRPDQEGN